MTASTGWHVEAERPSKASVTMPEAFKAGYTVFKYDGGTENFRGWRIRGLVLPAKDRESYARYDLECPYDGCRQRQLRARHQGGREKPWWPHDCKDGHRIYIDLEKFLWR